MSDFPVRKKWTPSAPLAAILFSVLTAIGCATDGMDGSLGEAESGDESLGGGASEFLDNEIVVRWNQIAFDAAVAFDAFDDFAVNLRGMTMMHLAIHDALNSIIPVYRQYALVTLRPLAHPTAAVAQAGHDVLVHVYPDQQAALDAELAASLAEVPGTLRKQLGIKLGRDAAAAIIARRTGDRMDVFGEYVPNDGEPGEYQFVPPLEFVFRPAFGDSVPFGLQSGDQLRSPPPPGLTSPEYAVSYDEVQIFGALESDVRTEDQSHEAQWWFEPAEAGWNRTANLIAREQDVRLYPAARMFALVNLGLIDAYVAVWNDKQFYDAWRPFTAIRAGDTDDNPDTEPDPAFEAFCLTPPIQEYPSAHAMQSSSAAEMLVAALGRDDVSFETESFTAPPERPTRAFDSLREAAEEAADSRVMCGIHFRFATDAGLAAGREVAQFILQRHLRPRW